MAEAEATKRRRLIRFLGLAEAARVEAFAGKIGCSVEAKGRQKRLASELAAKITLEKGAAAEIESKVRMGALVGRARLFSHGTERGKGGG